MMIELTIPMRCDCGAIGSATVRVPPDVWVRLECNCDVCGKLVAVGRRITHAGQPVPEVVDHEDALAEKGIHQQ